MKTYAEGGPMARLIRFVDDMDMGTAAQFDASTNLVRINIYAYRQLTRWEQNTCLFTKSPKISAGWSNGVCAIPTHL